MQGFFVVKPKLQPRCVVVWLISVAVWQYSMPTQVRLVRLHCSKEGNAANPWHIYVSSAELIFTSAGADAAAACWCQAASALASSARL